jgi:hypothetical protein
MNGPGTQFIDIGDPSGGVNRRIAGKEAYSLL